MNAKDTQSPWWAPARHADRRPALMLRGRIKTAIRRWFEAQDFTEVDAGILQVSPGNETHLHGFRTELTSDDGGKRELYLHTSPELACKKLLAAGETRIFDFARVFRDRERSALHHPEFTMLEWYRAGAKYQALMDDCAALLALAAETAGRPRFEFRGRHIDPFARPERLTLAEAFERFTGIALLDSITASGETDREAFAAAAGAAGVIGAADDSWSDIFTRVLVERIEPRIGNGRATILCEYPMPEAALARRAAHDPRVSERFEIYACGIELANAFGELNDAAVQRQRFEAEMALKQIIYGERYPIDEDFLAALAILPQASGAAMGFDRLVMLAAGASRIDHVLWTPLA